MHANDFLRSEYACNLIRFKARQLSRGRGFTSSDEDDLQQELWLALFNQVRRYDPARASLDTFIDRVVNTAAAMLSRDRQRQKRANGFRAASLDATSHRDQATNGAESVSAADVARRTGHEPGDEVADRESAEAIAFALEKMPPELRDVCRMLMTGTTTSVARALGKSPRQVRNAKRRARDYFERAGFSQD